MPLYAPGTRLHEVMFVDDDARALVRRKPADEPALARAAFERLISLPAAGRAGAAR